MAEFNFQQDVLDKIYRQAIEEYPSECCGWVLIDKAGNQEYYRAENLQDKYHKLDPENYPRTSKDAFLINTLKLNNAIEEASSKGGHLYSIVHSHIDTEAYFSEEDKLQMATPDKQNQTFPADNYLVISVKQKEIAGKALFYFDNNLKEFIASS